MTRANWPRIAALVLFALAIASLCLQSGVTSYRTPEFWKISLRMADLRIEVFSGKLSGSGILGTFETWVSPDAVLARQFGIVYQDGKWGILK